MSNPLFDPSLLQELSSLVPSDLALRPLSSEDYSHSHLSLLSHLTSSPDIGSSAWSSRFEELLKINKVYPTYFPVALVSKETNDLVGAATLVVELKFLRGGGKCGHVEDVVVHPSMQGKKLGQLLLNVLTKLSEQQGCYKTILDCDPKNEAFYAKCGYENKGCEMAKYAEKK
ncbi:glucosamine 6-phosphate N-acetyltransferase [Sporobolomyces salmoneus]|uniref:glucosamine 6-phosphate N-acetyltransferase n=1 Tax=Sporobolomyces salmoneus TaxID=183962 RepID=UPI0031791081